MKEPDDKIITTVIARIDPDHLSGSFQYSEYLSVSKLCVNIGCGMGWGGGGRNVLCVRACVGVAGGGGGEGVELK